jgi:hypothetical protein
MRAHRIGLLAVAAIGVAGIARADDVSDQIQRALSAYRQHDPQGALSALDAAANLLRQQRADALKGLLPLPPPGWTAEAAETTALSAAVLGGGTSASRTYRKGDEQVDVQITADNPMLQGMAALVSSPLAAASGIKTVVVGGRPMAYTPSDNGYMSLIGEKVIVKVEGNKQTPEPELRSFLAAMDFDAIEKLAH